MENSKIEWTDHTFNPWEGCVKISPGCKHCYADAQHQLHHSSLKAQAGTCWGVNAPRLGKSAENWKKPLRWNREAQAAGVRARVFCASMADVFEAQSELSRAFAGQTNQVPIGGGKTRTVTFVDIAAERLRLLRLIYDTPHLDWLLLTKRPENIVPALGAACADAPRDIASSKFGAWLGRWALGLEAPANVWLGTSVENQEQADARIPHLLAAPAAVRFLSCEPLLGPVDLTNYLSTEGACPTCQGDGSIIHYQGGEVAGGSACPTCQYKKRNLMGPRISWVIVGGESGPKARPMHPDWARSLRDQCQAAGVPFFFKQWGQWRPLWPYTRQQDLADGASVKRGQLDYSQLTLVEKYVFDRVGKHAAGRELDGRTWDEVPQGKEVAR